MQSNGQTVNMFSDFELIISYFKFKLANMTVLINVIDDAGGVTGTGTRCIESLIQVDLLYG